MRGRVKMMTTLLLLATGATVAGAAPSGRQVVAKYVKAVGGAKTIKAIESFHVTGAYLLEQPPVEGTIELFFSRPNKLLMKVELPGFGTIRRGYDGEVAWSIQPGQGAQILEGPELAHLKTQAMRGFSLLPSIEMFESVEYEGSVEFDGRTCHAVRLVAKETGAEYVEYFDAESGLLTGRDETVPSLQGKIDMHGVVSEMRKHGKLKLPTVWAHAAGGQKWKGIYKTFEANQVAAAVFELPDEVRSKLVKPQKKGSDEVGAAKHD